MSPTLDEQIEQLKKTITDMEAQRSSLGDAVVNAALAPLQQKLDELTALLVAREVPPTGEPAQQRKLVTLLFMDIAGSTSIAQHMDPEDVSEVFDVTLKKLAAPIEAHGGRVTRFMGDGFLSVFGAVIAREDDPEQAVRASLQVLELAQELAPELQKKWGIPDFQVRAGINTGLVLLGGETEAEDTLMGAAVNLAARLESAAPPGGLLISHDTYRHVRGVFDVEPWEPLKVKGFDEPAHVYHVQRVRPRAFRLYTRGVEGIETRMVGRETELKYLQDALLTAIEEGEGQMVTIAGEAGVGKSRLLYEFQDWIELLPPPAVRFFEGRARQEAQGLPYGLLRALFEFRFQIQDDDSAEIARQKISTGFEEVLGGDQGGEMRTHLLGHWLGYDFSDSPHLRGVLTDAEQLRNRCLMYLVEYFKALSGHAPVVIFLEDIHWADDSSLDAVNWMEERLHHQSLLVVCAARPTLFERRPYWGEGLSYHRRLELEPLSRRESRQLVAEILKLVPEVPSDLRELVVEGAEGNPFYVEELIKMLVEEGVIVKEEESWHIEPSRLSEVQVPPTLAGVLQARLDSLPQRERTVLQQASVVGRLFWDRVIAYIRSADDGGEEIVPQALTTLRGRELIYRREASSFSEAREYIFKHDILREVTYGSVLKRLRRRYHGLVADWLIAQGTKRAGEYSGMIAGHLLLAGRKKLACQYFLQAGEVALASYANQEAEEYFRQALELSLEDQQRASSLASLGEALRRQGRREESIQVFRKGIDLYTKLGEIDTVAELYARLSLTHWYNSDQKAWDVCQEGLRLLEGAPEGPGMARLLAEAGRTAFFQKKPMDEVISLCQRAVEKAEHQGALEAKADASNTIALATESIGHMQDVIAFSEANGLWRQAARAHINISYLYSVSFISMDAAYQHDWRSVDITKRIGDIEMLFVCMTNLRDDLFQLGYLNTVEDELREILSDSNVPQVRIDDFMSNLSPKLFYRRGEWVKPLEYIRQRLDKLRECNNLERIPNNNLDLVSACFELNRFAGRADLAEAEAALRENLQMGWAILRSHFRMVTLLSRQKRIAEAHEWLTEVVNDLDQPINKQCEVLLLESEAELARAEGHWDAAIVNNQALIDIYKGSGYRWEWARQLIDLGDALDGRGGPGDREQAKDVFKQSLDMFIEMESPGYIKLLEERLKE